MFQSYDLHQYTWLVIDHYEILCILCPFCAYTSIFRYKCFLRSCFLCFVHKSPSIFLAFLCQTRLQLFLWRIRLRRLISVELSSLDSVHSPKSKRNRLWHSLERFGIFAKSEGTAMRMEYTDSNDIISVLPKQPPSNEL